MTANVTLQDVERVAELAHLELTPEETQGMLRDLDERAARLNISRQAVIKTLLGRALNEEREHKAGPKNR